MSEHPSNAFARAVFGMPKAEPRMCADCDEQLEPTQFTCPFCDEPTRTVDDVMCERWERQQEDFSSEPSMSARERHEAAYRQKQELRR